MSLYTIAAATLTTEDDRRRSAAVSHGQIARTMMLCVSLAAAMATSYHFQARAASGSPSTIPAAARSTAAPQAAAGNADLR